MKRLWKVLVGIFAMIGLWYVGVVTLFSTGQLGEVECEVFPVLVLKSPDGKYVAEQEQVKCSPEYDLKTIVLVGETEFKSRTVAFDAKSVVNESIGEGTITVELKIRWVDTDTLEIVRPANVSIENSMIGSEFDNVKVIGGPSDV